MPPKAAAISISSLLEDAAKTSKDTTPDSQAVIVIDDTEDEAEEKEISEEKGKSDSDQPTEAPNSIPLAVPQVKETKKAAEKPPPRKRKPRVVKKVEETNTALQASEPAVIVSAPAPDLPDTPSKNPNILHLVNPDTSTPPPLVPATTPSTTPTNEQATQTQTSFPTAVFPTTTNNTATTSTTTSASTASIATSKKETKPRAPKKAAEPKEKKEPKSKREPKVKVNKKDEEKKDSTPAPSLTPDQLQNQSLKQPKPTSTLPPPSFVEIQKGNSISGSPKGDSASELPVTEPIIALNIPLISKEEERGSTQVVFNVMKMTEDKYGWKNVHPNASKFMDLLNDDDMEDDDGEGDAVEDEEEPKEPPAKVDGRTLQKGKPKIGQYDTEDPFIDDTEMLYEEQRASTKDGFFVYYGPLVEEGQHARIERADGTIKRSRKRVAGTSTASAQPKKKPTPAPSRSHTTSVNPVRPLVAIAPAPK